jgi:catechol 2,3-dioxygenase-like lactoylglutathione lyase family enzyme
MKSSLAREMCFWQWGQADYIFTIKSPKDRSRGAIHHLGIKVADLRGVWQRLQAEGLTSPHGLREQNGWRYVMITAPDGILLELFEFDDPSAAVNLSGRV